MWGDPRPSTAWIPICLVVPIVNPCFVPSNQTMIKQFFVACVWTSNSSWDDVTHWCRSCALRFWETWRADTCNTLKLSGIIYSTLTVETCNTFAILPGSVRSAISNNCLWTSDRQIDLPYRLKTNCPRSRIEDRGQTDRVTILASTLTLTLICDLDFHFPTSCGHDAYTCKNIGKSRSKNRVKQMERLPHGSMKVTIGTYW